MVDIYTNTRSKFTVDDHDHDLFNPRDLTLWVLQLLRYDIVSVDTFLNAWAYEANRIFRDRLVGAKSQDQFDSMRRNAMIQFFNANVDVEKLCYTSMVTFGDNGVPSGDLRRISMGDYKKMVEEGLKSYEREVKGMPIDLFQEVMDHLACADRALSAPHYNDIMLVGRSRVGRRSLVSLIAHMQRLTVFSPATSRKYDDKEWKRDLKQVMQMTGIERQHTVFFLEDHHMVKSEFLESINSLLSCGDVPGIWTPMSWSLCWHHSRRSGPRLKVEVLFSLGLLSSISSTRYAATCVLCCPWMRTTHISSLSAPRTQLSSVVATSCGWTIGARRACTSWSSGS